MEVVGAVVVDLLTEVGAGEAGYRPPRWWLLKLEQVVERGPQNRRPLLLTKNCIY